MDHRQRDQRGRRGRNRGLTGELAALLAQLFQIGLELAQPFGDLAIRRIGYENGNAALAKKGFHEGVGVAHDGVRDSAVHQSVQPQHSGYRVPGRERHDDLKQFPDQQLSQVLDLFHHLASREASRGGRLAVMVARIEPELCGLPAERRSELHEKIDQEGELAFQRWPVNVPGASDSLPDPIRPILDEVFTMGLNGPADSL